MRREIMPTMSLGRRLRAGVSAAALAAPLLFVGQADAKQLDCGNVDCSFDTTLTVGALFRVQHRDSNLVGMANGGYAPSMNGDNGNLNYDRGLVSLAGRATHEMKLGYENLGAFVRATYFYDVVNAERGGSMGSRTDRFGLSDAAIERVGKDFDLLDAMVYGNFDVGESNLGIRLGNQVLSWGESTFIPNGINTINPIDVSALRVPGSELKEAFVPVPIADVNISFGDFSLEAFYQFKWDNTEPEAANTYFSTNEAASPGSRYLFIGFGHPAFRDVSTQRAVSAAPFPATVRNIYTGQDQQVRIGGPTGPVAVGAQSLTGLGTIVPRQDDDEPSDSGQFGVAARLFVPQLNDTEFGAYFINYHSRVPVLSTFLGSAAALNTFLATGGAQGDFTGGPTYENGETSYRAEYPEDIKLFGLSFNTSIPGVGVSLQGEYSYRQDQALQLDDVELLQATLAAPSVLATIAGANAGFDRAVAGIVAATPTLAPFAGRTFEQIQAVSPTAAAGILAGIRQVTGITATSRDNFIFQNAAPTAGLFNTNQIVQRDGLFPLTSTAAIQGAAVAKLGQRIQGWALHDVSQAQMTATKAFGPFIGANQWVLLGEVGMTYIHDLPDQSVLRYDGPGTVVGGNPLFSGRGGMPYSISSGFATDFSWGYRLAARFDYLNAISGVNLAPSISWSHDVSGTTPGPIGNFLEGRKALSVGLRALYKEAYQLDVGYSAFWGAQPYNGVADRDFVSVSVKYSF